MNARTNSGISKLPTDRVAVLMAVHNGAAYLKEQVDSFAAQSHDNWHLLASIDGNQDGSRELIAAHRIAPRTELIDGPKKGAGPNFLSMMQRADPSEFWAFSDQDDVWMREKIERALSALSDVPVGTPALYHSSTIITNADLGNPQQAVDRSGPSGFSNSLAQNIVAGNTVVLNPAAAFIVQQAAQEAQHYVIHDWWLYQILTGIGGQIKYDPEPSLFYRQHDSNVIGANSGIGAKYLRLKRLFDGTYKDWNDRNAKALALSAHRFTTENQDLLARFTDARSLSALKRWQSLREIGLHRKDCLTNAAMWGTILLGRY